MDGIRARTSKKDAESRIEEVRKAASEDLLKWIEKDGAMLSRETSGCLVLAEVMWYAKGGQSLVFLDFKVLARLTPNKFP